MREQKKHLKRSPQEKIERADRESGGKDRSYTVPSGRGGSVDSHITREQTK